jgi:hypothetical protein
MPRGKKMSSQTEYNKSLDFRIEESIRQRQKKHSLWRLWAKALGEKAADCDRESDKVAVVRTIIAGINLVTCIFIVAGIIRHW